MIKKFLLVSLLIIGSIYFLYPRSGFPPPPPNSYVSNEPADTETIYRQAYFSNLNREEVLNYYKKSYQPLFIRLNHPPEEALTLIRDQTKSSWLEELVHPGVDNIYINGFYPTKPTEQININGVHYNAKITVRYIPSHPITRLTVFALCLVAGFLLIKEYSHV